jgi:Fe-S-cluster containining protein
MTEQRTCGGECCAVFWLPKDVKEPGRMDNVRDGAFIADMVIPLTRPQALRRWRKFVSIDRPLPTIPVIAGNERATFTCRHWDEKTRLCGIYEQRPDMCRRYPYGSPCSHGCSYQIEPEAQ